MARIKKAHVADGCVACGCCVQVCPTRAIAVYRGVAAQVEASKCVGCGKCAAACPAGIIAVVGEEAVAG